MKKYYVGITIIVQTFLLNSLIYSAQQQGCNNTVIDFNKNKNEIKNKHKKNKSKVLITIAPYLGIDAKSLVIMSLYNQDLLLLKQRQILEKNYDLNLHPPAIFEVSGLTSGIINAHIKNEHLNDVKEYLDTTELDFGSHLDDWITLFFNFIYNNQSPRISGRVGNSNIYFDRAFITFGNLNRSPIYTTLGKRYVPFGQYNSYMISGSLAQPLGKTEASSLLVGYQHRGDCGVYSSIYILKGVKKLIWDSKQTAISGFTAGYELFNSDFGIDYIQSITAAQDFQNFSGINNFNKNIPGVGLHVKLNRGNVTFLAEHIMAMTRLNKNLLAYNNHGAKPAIANFEIGYQLKTFSKPSFIAIGYGKTYESAAFGLPAQRFNSTYSISLSKHIIVGIEYQYNINYPLNILNANSNEKIAGIDKNIILMRLMLYF